MKPVNAEKKTPQLIEEKPGFRLWHYQDAQFPLPKGTIYLSIDSASMIANVKHCNDTYLCRDVLDSLISDTYQAELAGLAYHMYTHQGGVTLVISGFTDKQPELLKIILERFHSRQLTLNALTILKRTKRIWLNSQKDKPVSNY